MSNLGKAALFGLGLAGAVLAGGCAPGTYDDDGYYRHDRAYRHDSHEQDWRDRERVRVCDADGDNCHWEYRRR